MGFTTLEVRAEGEVGELVLARPERLNALSATTLRELRDAARWFDARPEIRVVVVRGEGRAFCAGADLRDPPVAGARPGSGLSWAERREVGQLGHRMATAVEEMRAITVASVHGHVVGGGLVLMLACDLRVAATDARFRIPEVELGIPLAWGGIPRLVREVGPSRTRDLVMTGRPFDAAEALALGVVNRVAEPERLADETRALVETLLGRPQVPLSITKEHVAAVARALAGTTAFADGDALLASVFDPESLEAARRYLAARGLRGRGRS